MLQIPTDQPGGSAFSESEAHRQRPVSENLLAVQSAWKARGSSTVGRATALPLLIHAFSPGCVVREARAQEILARAEGIDAQSLLRSKRREMGFDKYSESRLLEDFEFRFPDDDDEDEQRAFFSKFAIGDEDDDELERHDQEVEDEEYILLDMQDDDDDVDVTDAGDDPEGEQEWALPADDRDQQQDVWAQVLGLVMSLHSGRPESRPGTDRPRCVAVQPQWSEPWHLPAYYQSTGSPMPEPAELAAVLRYWGRQWGAEPVLMGPDVLACLVQRVPQDRGTLRKLAEEHLAFQPRQDLSSRLPRQIMQDLSRGRLWQFHW